MKYFDPTKMIFENLEILHTNRELRSLNNEWLSQSIPSQYLYNFTWLGIPIIQLPQDMYAVQELIWKVKPDLVIETGVAHGGSLFLSSSILRMLDINDCLVAGKDYIPSIPKRKVVGVEIQIREENLLAIISHPLSTNIELVQGSSVDLEVVSHLTQIVKGFESVLVILDSRHTRDHVARELEIYSKFVSVDSYIIVMDTFIENLPKEIWRSGVEYQPGNSPMIACKDFLTNNTEFEADYDIEKKLQLTSSPSGFLRRIF